MHATLDANCLPPQRVKAPGTIGAAKLREETATLRAVRRHIENDWFDMPLDVRAILRAFPQQVEAALERPGLWVFIQALGRILWHMFVDYESYFTALYDYAREAGRLTDTIRAKVEQEDKLHQQLFAETDFDAVRSSEGYTQAHDGELIPGTVEDLQRRREARRSRATG